MISMAEPSMAEPSNEMESFMDLNLSQSEHGTMVEQVSDDQIDLSMVDKNPKPESSCLNSRILKEL